MAASSWACIVFATIIKYCTSTIWSGLFLDADISFVFTPDSSYLLDMEKDLPYFDLVLVDNPNVPMRNFVLNQSTFESKDHVSILFTQLKVSHGSRDTEKSARQKVIFINMVVSVKWEDKCDLLLRASDLSFQQEYAFGYVHRSKDLACLFRHTVFFGHTKSNLVHGWFHLTPFRSMLDLRSHDFHEGELPFARRDPRSLECSEHGPSQIYVLPV